MAQIHVMPVHPAHAASFVGKSFRLFVVCNNLKTPVVTHTNAYVGHLRQQVRVDFSKIL